MIGAIRSRIAFCLAVGRDAVVATYRHDCTTAAPAMAFDFIFAIFPGILVLTALLGFLGISPEDFIKVLEFLGIVIPVPLLAVVEDNINFLSSQGLFVIGFLGVIWPASASMSTTMMALNRAYGVQEHRSFYKRRILSLALIVVLGISFVFFFNLIIFGEHVESWLRGYWTSPHFAPLVALLRRAVVVIGMVTTAACIYYIMPAVRLRWLDVLPGSVMSSGLAGIIASALDYIERFSYYNIIYGVLGTAIILLLSAYLLAFTLLLGGELNAVLYHRRHSFDAHSTDY